MSESDEMFRNAKVIVAHADDEILWLSSTLRRAGEVMVVYHDFWAEPHLADARAASLAEFPHPNISTLGIPEPGSFSMADWAMPEPDEYGLQFNNASPLHEAKQELRRALHPITGGVQPPAEGVHGQYRENAATLYETLKPRLSAEMNVFSHNPWGEYGHECHVQVFRVLARLRREIGFRLWVSNYASDRSLVLWERHAEKAPERMVELPTDKEIANQAMAIYKRHGCWTWQDDWRWFDTEILFEPRFSPETGEVQNARLPLNMIRMR